MKEVLIATNNAHKVEEIRTALNFEGWTFTTLAEAGVASDPAEDADSFEGNARIKARAARAAARESLGRFVAVLADDSGLEVDALGGAPGVYSARYGGEGATDADRNVKLLRELRDIPEGRRGARFVSAVCCVFPNGERLTVRGECEGRIGFAPRGEGGFGYDPLFLVGDKTYSELTDEEKDAVSHRGEALRKFAAALQEYRRKNAGANQEQK